MPKIDILIVDDSPAFNHLTKLTIERAGLDCNITELSNGQRALDHLATLTRCPEIILLDINMPVMDGFDFLQEFMRMEKCQEETAIYMLTSSSQDVDKVRVRSFGIVRDYFEKPLSREDIEKIIAGLKTT